MVVENLVNMFSPHRQLFFTSCIKVLPSVCLLENLLQFYKLPVWSGVNFLISSHRHDLPSSSAVRYKFQAYLSWREPTRGDR